MVKMTACWLKLSRYCLEGCMSSNNITFIDFQFAGKENISPDKAMKVLVDLKTSTSMKEESKEDDLSREFPKLQDNVSMEVTSFQQEFRFVIMIVTC